MSANNNSLTEHELHLATQYELELEYLTSPAALPSIEEYFGPGGAFWSQPIIFDGESIFDDNLNIAGEGNSNIGDVNGTDTSMDISMGDATDSDKTIDNGIGDATTSESNTLTDRDLFRSFLVSDIDDESKNNSNDNSTQQQAREDQHCESHKTTSDLSPTSPKPDFVQKHSTSPPTSPNNPAHPHGTDGAIDSSPPAPQQRSSRVSKPKPQYFHRRTTRSMKGAEKRKQETEDEQEEVETKRSKANSVASEVENAKGGKSLPARKRTSVASEVKDDEKGGKGKSLPVRQQPKQKSGASEVDGEKITQNLPVRKRQQPKRAVKSKKQ